METEQKTFLKISKKIKDEAPDMGCTKEFYISEIMEQHNVSEKDAKVLFLAALSRSLVAQEVFKMVEFIIENQ